MALALKTKLHFGLRIGFLIFCASPALAEERLSSGTITLANGAQYEALSIDSGCFTFLTDSGLTGWLGDGSLRSDGSFLVHRPEGDARIAIRSDDVAAFSIDETVRSQGSCCRWISGGTVELKNGSVLNLLKDKKDLLIYTKRCRITIEDDFTETIQEIELDFSGKNAVARVDYTGLGTYRWSDSSQEVFPPSFLFDPYTGERTEIRGGSD